MSQDTSQEKTEAPTRKKLEDARKEGQVVHSKDISTALILLVGVAFMLLTWSSNAERFYAIMVLPEDLVMMPFYQALELMGQAVYDVMMGMIFPLLLLIILTALIGNFLVVGPVFSMKSIAPQADRINPASGFKKIFSAKNFFEVVKGFCVFVVFVLVFYIVFMQMVRYFGGLVDCGIECSIELFKYFSLWIFLLLLLIVTIIAVFDYIVQRAIFMKEMMMTKEEIKREYKEREGDPVVKGQRKRMAREMVDTPMVDVSQATIVVTAGSQLVVALYYDRDKMPLPVLVAKGKGEGASKIVYRAQSHQVKVAQNASLAQQLYEELQVGGYIKEHMIEAVAGFMGEQGL